MVRRSGCGGDWERTHGLRRVCGPSQGLWGTGAQLGSQCVNGRGKSGSGVALAGNVAVHQ